MSEALEFKPMLNNMSTVVPMLNQLKKMNNTVILAYPETVIEASSKDMWVRINWEGLGEEEFSNIPLLDSVSRFTQYIGLFSEHRQIATNGKMIQIKDGQFKSEFKLAAASLMKEYDVAPKMIGQFNKTREIPSVASFTLNRQNIDMIKKATSVFKDLPSILITGKDGDTELSIGAKSRFNAVDNSYGAVYADSSTKEFEIAIPVENFLTIPSADYTFEVKYNSAVDKYRILLSHDEFGESFEFMLTVIA